MAVTAGRARSGLFFEILHTNGVGEDRVAASPFFAMLGRELAPTPLRFRLAFRSGLACGCAMGVALSLQQSSASVALAGAFPLMLLSAATVCTWSNMVSRLVILAVLSAGAVPLAGALTDTPWLMLPVGFAIVTLGSYLAPVMKRPLTWISSLTAVASIMLAAVMAPTTIGTTAAGMATGIGISVVVSTLFARLLWPQDPRQVLANQLADSYRESRALFDAAVDRYLTTESETEATPPQVHCPPGLTANLQALDAADQGHPDAALTPGRLGLVTVSQRISISVATLQQAATLPLPRSLRSVIQPALLALKDRFDAAMDEYAARTRLGLGDAVEPPAHVPTWPDLGACVDDLDELWKRTIPSEPAARAEVRVAGTGFEAMVAVLRGLASELRLSPEALIAASRARLARVTKAPRERPRFRLDGAAASAAAKGGLATMLAFVVVVASGHLGYQTATWTCLLLIQSSYGAIVRKSLLRLIGGLCGGVLALIVIISVVPNASGPFFYILAAIVVTAFADYGGRASQQVSYGFLQTGITYMICVAALQPSADVDEPLDRLMGILIGIAATFVCFRFFARDYAGNQVLSKLASMLGPLTTLVPQAGRPVPSREQVVAIERLRSVGTADVLRLVDEADFEGKASGINTSEALVVLAATRRVAIHVGAIGFSHAEASSLQLPAPLGATLKTLRDAIVLWIDASHDVLVTAEKLGRPDARLHHKGREAILRSARRPLPPLRPLLEDVLDAYRACAAQFKDWPMREIDLRAAELVHIKSLVDVLPELHKAVVKTCLPEVILQNAPSAAAV